MLIFSIPPNAPPTPFPSPNFSSFRLVVKPLLEAPKGGSNITDTTQRLDCIGRRTIFQLQQFGQLVAIQFAFADLHILPQHEIDEIALLGVVARQDQFPPRFGPLSPF